MIDLKNGKFVLFDNYNTDETNSTPNLIPYMLFEAETGELLKSGNFELPFVHDYEYKFYGAVELPPYTSPDNFGKLFYFNTTTNESCLVTVAPNNSSNDVTIKISNTFPCIYEPEAIAEGEFELLSSESNSDNEDNYYFTPILDGVTVAPSESTFCIGIAANNGNPGDTIKIIIP